MKEIKKAKKVELARYLGVTRGAISQYNDKKLELMLIGLVIKKEAESLAKGD